jgi:hypothetical protein
MKRMLLVIMICVFLSGLPGCEKADEALKALDKAKTVKEDIDKKTKEVKDKVQSIIPGLMGDEKKSDGPDKEGKEGGGDKEKHD